MSRLPALSARKVAAALERAGLVLVRTKGSHYRYQHPIERHRQTVVPFHVGDLPPGTLRVIIKQAGLTVAEFVALL